ncbi:hypothetical protein WN944_015431 [Citrus x changshan-huyou]|uniref:Uncharacterized protein n=1 Tax=Citrus x changshan-huyou TaxID=2935761 RepID=A0AAP0M8Y6_9ROSI
MSICLILASTHLSLWIVHFSPDLRLRGLTSEGSGLSWSKFKEGHLLSGAYDSQICLCDIAAAPNNKALDALRTFKVNNAGVEDVAWHMKHDYLFGSVGDDNTCLYGIYNSHQRNILSKMLLLTRRRIGEEQSPEEAAEGPPELLFIHGGHTSKIYDFSWNPCEDWIMASVAEDNIIQIWQMADHIYNDEDEDDLLEDNSPKGS